MGILTARSCRPSDPEAEGSTTRLRCRSQVQCRGLLSKSRRRMVRRRSRSEEVGVLGGDVGWGVGVGTGQDEWMSFRCRQSVAGSQPPLSDSDLTPPHCPGLGPRFGCGVGRGWEVGWGWDGVGRSVRRRWSVAGGPRSTVTRAVYSPDLDDQSVWVVPCGGCSCYPLASLRTGSRGQSGRMRLVKGGMWWFV